MAIQVSAYRKDSAFSTIPVPTLVFCDKVEVYDYEYISTVSIRSNDTSNNVDIGQFVAAGTENSIRTLKILDKVTGHYLWIKETKEQFQLYCAEQSTPPAPVGNGGGSSQVIVISKQGPVILEAVGGETEFGPIASLYAIKDYVAVFNSEGKTVIPHTDDLPVPAGNYYKIHTDNKIYLGYEMMPLETLTILR